tara:strand:+ start:876 stop:1451 length:576 start_codon:yes stop_codon:yes gene_type:complete
MRGWNGGMEDILDYKKWLEERILSPGPPSVVAYIYYKKEGRYSAFHSVARPTLNQIAYINPDLFDGKHLQERLWKKLRPVCKEKRDDWTEVMWKHILQKYTQDIKIPRVFARKIAEKWLEAKYNPRTVIGEKFHNKLYNEYFDEDNLELFSSDGETEEEKKVRLEVVKNHLEEEEKKESFTIYGVGTVEIQ